MIKMLYPFARKWSESGSVWIYSDPHFGDADCKLMDPDWPDPDNQIKILRQCCHKNDTLILLGDIGNPEHLQQLKCYKVMIAGNHDIGLTKYKEYFDEIYGGPLFISDRILLSHEPMPEMPYVLNIHGHDHNGHKISDNHLNVCSNVVGFVPLNLGKLIKGGLVSDVPTIHRWTIDYID